MYILVTRSARHLRDAFALPVIDYTLKTMSDGELFININQSVKGKNICVVTSTQAPAENILELFFLLDAIMRERPQSITLFFTYFGYARQSQVMPGEACSAQVVSTMIKQFAIKKIYIMHVHAPDQLQQFVHFTHIIDWDFFCMAAQDVDVIVAPDYGAQLLAQTIAQRMHKEVVVLHKKRIPYGQVIMQQPRIDMSGKKALVVDDIIVTGDTLIKAVQVLKSAGAVSISVAVTHALSSLETFKKLKSLCEHIYITNSIAQQKKSGAIIWNSAPQIRSLFK